MVKVTNALLLLLLVVGGCGKDYRPIVNGTYVTPSGGEWISVRESEIHFYIRLGDGGSDKFLDRTYSNYSVLPDGSIEPYPMTSSDAVFGFGKFDWYWDGEKIIQKNPKSDEPFKSFVLKSNELSEEDRREHSEVDR